MKKKILYSSLLLLLFNLFSFAQTTETFTSDGALFVPCGVTSIAVECWGAGGGGAGSASGAGGGGGGGGYSNANITTVPGSVINYTVGVGGAGSVNDGVDGGNTSFSSVSATGGLAGKKNGSGGGQGSGSSSIGTAGGTGSSSFFGNVGGNGGAAGGIGGGTGGAGSKGSDGHPGAVPGGGGGGAGGSAGQPNLKGGNGGNGIIKITYTGSFSPSQPGISSGGSLVAVCSSTGSQTSSLAYTSASNSPASYSIDWNAAANTAGLSDQARTGFAFSSSGGSLTGIAITANTLAGTYTGLMTLYNGCGTVNKGVSIVVNAVPSAPVIGTITQATCASPTASVVLGGLPASGSWVINALPATTGLTGLSGTGTGTTIGGLTPGSTYSFKVSRNGCASGSSSAVSLSSLITKTWNGSAWSPNPSIAPTSNDAVIINGNYIVNDTNGNINACSLTINSPAVVTVPGEQFVTVQNDITINTGATLDILDGGSLIMVNDLPGPSFGVSNNGTLRVQRNTAAFNKYDYTYWSSPMVGSTAISNSSGTPFANWRTDYAFAFHPENFIDLVTASTGLAPSDGLDDNGDTWLKVNSMEPGRGYIIMGPTWLTSYPAIEAVVFQGKVNNGVIETAIQLAPDLSVVGNFNLVGNPYPSAISADALINANISTTGTINRTIDGTLYFWTHKTKIGGGLNLGSYAQNFSQDDYAMYNLSGGAGTSGSDSGSLAPLGYIASGQGFFVQAEAAGLLTFTNAMRLGVPADANSQFFKTTHTKNVKKDRLWLNLENELGMFSQQLVGYFDNATDDHDNGYDGLVSNAGNYVSFYSFINDKAYKIQGRKPYNQSDQVRLGYFSAIAGTFNINIDSKEGIFSYDGTSVYLEDKLLDVIHDLKESAYSFSTEVGSFDNRFLLRYTDKTLGIENNEVSERSNVSVFTRRNEITVSSVIEQIDKLFVYDLTGKLVYKNLNVESNLFTLPNLVLGNQLLLLKVQLENGELITKKVMSQVYFSE